MSEDKIKNKIDDGGGVTPMHNLTIRDYFAAKAMASMVVRGNEYKNAHARKLMSEMAYAIADAMIAARKEDK